MQTVLLMVTLLDGSQINLKVNPDTKLHLSTPYGELQVPLSQLQIANLASHPEREDEHTILAAIKDLRSNDYKLRDQATRLLALNMREAYRFIAADKTADAEAAKREETLLKSVSPMPLYDSIKTADGAFAGMLTDKDIVGESLVGKLTIPISKVLSIGVNTLKKSLSIKPEDGWIQIGRGAGRLHINAAGAVDMWPQTLGTYVTGPDGHDNLAGAYRGCALIGRLDGKEEFLIGSSVTVTTGRMIEVRINASPWPSTTPTGNYDLTITQE